MPCQVPSHPATLSSEWQSAKQLLESLFVQNLALDKTTDLTHNVAGLLKAN